MWLWARPCLSRNPRSTARTSLRDAVPAKVPGPRAVLRPARHWLLSLQLPRQQSGGALGFQCFSVGDCSRCQALSAVVFFEPPVSSSAAHRPGAGLLQELVGNRQRSQLVAKGGVQARGEGPLSDPMQVAGSCGTYGPLSLEVGPLPSELQTARVEPTRRLDAQAATTPSAAPPLRLWAPPCLSRKPGSGETIFLEGG